MIKFTAKQFEKSTIILLFLYISVVYFSIALSNIFLGIASFVFVVGVCLKRIKLDFTNKNWKKYFVVIVPFLLTLLSVLYSKNGIYGIKYLWLRLPILFIPFIVVFMKVNTGLLRKGIAVFVTFTIIASLRTIYNALRYINEDIIFDSDFTFFITVIQHPYLGIFVLISFISIVEFKLIKYRYLKLGLFTVLLVTIALTTSRLVYLLSVIVIVLYLIKYLPNKKALFFASLFGIFSLMFVFSNKSIVHKFKTVYSYESSPRLKLWNNAFKVTKSTNSYLLGVGIGDYYENKKDVYFFKENDNGKFGYNPHSQLVEFYLTNGLFGLGVLIICFAFCFNIIREQNLFSILIFCLIILFSLTETIFNRQFGIQLYALFMPLLFKENFNCKKNET